MTKETHIQKAIIDFLKIEERMKRLYYVRVGSGMIRTQAGGYFKSGKAGVPDIVVCINGRFVGFEVKNEKGKQSTAQLEAQMFIEQAGGFYFIVRSINDVRDAINRVREATIA